MFDQIRRDFCRCGDSFRERLREMLLNPGMWAVAGYRYRRWVYTSGLPGWLRWPFTTVAIAAQLAAEVTTGIQLSEHPVVDGSESRRVKPGEVSS